MCIISHPVRTFTYKQGVFFRTFDFWNCVTRLLISMPLGYPECLFFKTLPGWVTFISPFSKFNPGFIFHFQTPKNIFFVLKYTVLNCSEMINTKAWFCKTHKGTVEFFEPKFYFWRLVHFRLFQLSFYIVFARTHVTRVFFTEFKSEKTFFGMSFLSIKQRILFPDFTETFSIFKISPRVGGKKSRKTPCLWGGDSHRFNFEMTLGRPSKLPNQIRNVHWFCEFFEWRFCVHWLCFG